MKIHILHEFINGPYGGGNQFLKALRDYFVSKGVYEEDYSDADTILVNSKDNLDLAESCKQHFNKKIVHRIDGVFGIYRNEPALDKLVHTFSNNVADGIIYQSKWSMLAHKERGLNDHSKETIIHNAANPKIFNTDYVKKDNDKITILTTSWSSNWGKGFKTLQYLDDNLNFDKYNYEFIGQSPTSFKNIKMTRALPQEELAERVKKCDIFFTATENDTCSNSLLEALSCGLPTIGLKSGGTTELISAGGGVYEHNTEILPLIDKVALNLENFRSKIKIDNMETIGHRYYEFIKQI